jgi:hypothetical protein
VVRVYGVRVGRAVVAAAVLALAAEIIAAWYLRDFDSRFQRIIATERKRADNYRRIVMFDAPVNRSAAAAYRVAFDNVSSISPVTVDRLVTAAVQGRNEPATLRAVAPEDCAEARRPEFRSAFQCTRCDWGIGYPLDDSTLLGFGSSANVLGYCLIVEGHKRSAHHDWRGAAQFYLEAISFGRDLGHGILAMNIAGIICARLGLKALSTLIGEVEDPELVSAIRTEVSKLDGQLPTLNPGVRFVRASLVAELANAARAPANLHKKGPQRLLSDRTIAAAYLLANARLVRHLSEAAEVNDSVQLDRLAREIRSDLARTPNKLVAYELPGHWERVAYDADHVVHLFEMVQAALTLQGWYIDHQEYPGDPSILHWPGGTHLRYAPFRDKHGYRIYDDNHAPTVFIERPSSAGGRSGSH